MKRTSAFACGKCRRRPKIPGNLQRIALTWRIDGVFSGMRIANKGKGLFPRPF